MKTRNSRWHSPVLMAILPLVLASCATKTPEELQAVEDQRWAQAEKVKALAESRKALAEEAYLFAYPMLRNYENMYTQAIDRKSERFKARFNEFARATRLPGPEDKDASWPNPDCLTSIAWIDLRTEPVVLSVPSTDNGRFYHFQIVDLFTRNFAYVGSRTTGTRSGSYLLAPTDWDRMQPPGVRGTLRTNSQFVLVIGRASAIGPNGSREARDLLEKCKLTPLSGFLTRPPRKDEPVKFPPYDLTEVKPATVGNFFQSILDYITFQPGEEAAQRRLRASANFIAILNFLLDHVSLTPEEQTRIRPWSAIGVDPGRPFNARTIDSAMLEAISAGVESAREKIKDRSEQLGTRQNGWVLLEDIRGENMGKQDLLTHAAAAQFQLYDNSDLEIFSPIALTDAHGETLDASRNNYTITFESGAFPPVKAFWSLALYGTPDQLPIANPIGRYAIGDFTEGLRYAEDGSVTLWIQEKEPEDPLKRANWLPAPDGPFVLVLRMYWPEDRAVERPYAPPGVAAIPIAREPTATPTAVPED